MLVWVRLWVLWTLSLRLVRWLLNILILGHTSDQTQELTTAHADLWVWHKCIPGEEYNRGGTKQILLLSLCSIKLEFWSLFSSCTHLFKIPFLKLVLFHICVLSLLKFDEESSFVFSATSYIIFSQLFTMTHQGPFHCRHCRYDYNREGQIIALRSQTHAKVDIMIAGAFHQNTSR